MKKWLFFTGLLILGYLCFKPTQTQSTYLGSYGQFFVPEDTVRVDITVHDTTGLVPAAWDSATILRYYRGVRIDSLDEASGQVANLRTGLYEIKFKADKEASYVNTNEDSIGQYMIVVDVWKQTKHNQKAWTYTVLRGNGLHGLYDIQWFLGAADNGYRALYPGSGLAPKDSVQYYRISDENGNGSIETGDTTHVSTVIFYHNSIRPNVLDSSKTVFHWDNL
jgi:hypothetical protein